MMVDGRWSMGRTLLELGRLAISCVVLLLVSQASVADNSRANPNGVRKLGLLRLESDQPISVGEVFVSELLTCIVTLSSDQNASSIESVKPSCSCVTVELSEPSKADGRILRDLIFAVKRDATGPFQSKVTVVFKDGIKRDILISGEVKPILVVGRVEFVAVVSASVQQVDPSLLIECKRQKIQSHCSQSGRVESFDLDRRSGS